MLNRRLKAWLSNSNDPLRKLLLKAPKTVTADIGEGLLARIFEQSKKYNEAESGLPPISF
jgi:hypothetical protein